MKISLTTGKYHADIPSGNSNPNGGHKANPSIFSVVNDSFGFEIIRS